MPQTLKQLVNLLRGRSVRAIRRELRTLEQQGRLQIRYSGVGKSVYILHFTQSATS